MSAVAVRLCRASILCALTVFVTAPNVLAQGSDNCATPQIISGNGNFFFDLTSATASGPPVFCGEILNDVWFCWTANCSGLVDVTTCGLTTVDTLIAYYQGGCVCPPAAVQPLCCNDDDVLCVPAPGVQSSIRCEVVCGQQYMIRIGHKAGTAPGTGFFSILCNGQPCDCDECCGRRPNFLTAAGFTGGVAAITLENGISNHVVEMINIAAQPPAGLGTNWPAPFYPQTPLQDWSSPRLGTVFGLAIDHLGNTYVGHTAVMGQSGDAIGTIAGAAAGAIYKIDTNTGVPTTFVVLPNNFITGCFGSDCWPGLGDLAYSCAHEILYASNFEDGRIYAINLGATVIGTWKHATGVASASGLPDPLDVNGFSPVTPHPTTGRGQRVFGIAVSRGRMYYGVWREDMGQPDPAQANEIWSVALLPSGLFVAGSEQLEFSMPPFAGQNFSNPVAGIAFKPQTCCMLVAERSMIGDTIAGAHASRMAELCKGAAGWGPSGNSFQFGDSAGGVPHNTAGGCDYDFATGPGVNVNIWGTADALKLSSVPPPSEAIYGLGGVPFTGIALSPKLNGLMIDSNLISTSADKFQQGDVQVTCPLASPPPCEPTPDGVACINQCPVPPGGQVCVPVEIVRGLDGLYRITRCDCISDGQCRLQYINEVTPPICVDLCPDGTPNCKLLARGNLDGTITFRCDCPPFANQMCDVVSECNPDMPGTCQPVCRGMCPPGQACYPVEIRENPVGSGHFQVVDCDCLPLDNPPCHPIVVNQQIVQCVGICPTGGQCRVIMTLEPPPPPPALPAARYRCDCNCVHPPANMADWWPMDDNPPVAPINDIVGVLNNGTPFGNVGTFTAPPACVVRGLSFNINAPINGFVQVPNVPGPADINFGTGNFTLEGWVQCDFPDAGLTVILDKRDAALRGYSMYIFNNKLGVQLASGVFVNLGATLLPNLTDGQCHHVAMVVQRGSPNTITLWVDGSSQSFTDNTIVGTVNNASPLTFGVRSAAQGGGGFYRGILDEWEFFRRALSAQEIISLYQARQLGKCREDCYTPSVVFCRNQTTRTVCFQVCNHTGSAFNYNWSLSGPLSSCGNAACGCGSAVTFTPSSGSTGVILPGQCKTVCVTMNRPACLPLIPPPNVTGCYQLTVTNTTTGNTFGCCNTFTSSKAWCFQCVPIWAIAKGVVGSTRHFALTATNEADPDGMVEFAVKARYPETGEQDMRVVSLNGLPPGTRYIGNLMVPVGGSTMVPFDVTILEDEPSSIIEIIVEIDADGDGEPDPVDRIAINTVVGCQDEAMGDMNEDGSTTTADIPQFVATLLGAAGDPYQMVLADANCDGAANGLDIPVVVMAILTTP